MADAKISELPAATLPLAGTEPLPLVQASETRRIAVDDVAAHALLARKVALWSTMGSTNGFNNASPGVMLWNFNEGTTGTVVARVPTTTNRFTRARRRGYTTGTGNNASIRDANIRIYRDDGLWASLVFGVATLPSSGDWNLFAGLINQNVAPANANLPGGASPVGFGVRRESDGWKVISADFSTRTEHAALSTTDFPANSAGVDLFALFLSSASAASAVEWEMQNLTTGATARGTMSTGLPTAGISYSPNVTGQSVNSNVGFGFDVSQLCVVTGA